MRVNSQRSAALTFVEVVIVVGTIALLVVVLLPAFQRTTSRGSGHARVRCTSNLKQMGIAYRLWSGDNGDKFPFAVSNQFGGTLEFTNSPEVFRHFATMSNELVSPKILVCPMDSARSRPTNFATFSNTNLSYFVGLDGDETMPGQLLSGDRNITGGTLSNGFLRVLNRNTLAGWTSEIHNKAGNIGLADGSVQQVNDQGLQRQLEASALPVIRLAIP